MTTLLEEVLFNLPEAGTDGIHVDHAFVQDRLAKISEDEDLIRYIL